MSRVKGILFAAAIAISLGTAMPADAATTLYTSLSAWQSAVGVSSETTNFGVDGTSITSYTLNGGPTVTLGTSTQVRTVPSSWSTWCCGYTGQVLFSTTDTATGTFSSPVSAFGIFAEPDNFGSFNITLTLSDSSTVTQTVQGDSGADFFGFTGAGITGYTFSADPGAAGFAIGDAFVSSSSIVVTPLPATLPLFATGLGALGLLGWRKKKKAAAFYA